MGVSTMGLLYQLETELEQEIPGLLRQSLPAALDVYQPLCPDCQLAMHGHHAYRRSIMTGYGAVELRIPALRCGECRRMSSGADVLGEVRKSAIVGTQKNRRNSPETAALGLGYAAASGWVGAVKSPP